MTEAPVLFFHVVDAQNLNAQSNNTKNILARWGSNTPPAAAFHFRDPDPSVAANKNVQLIKLPPNRLWKLRAFAAGLKRYSGLVLPGFDPVLDERVRRARQALGRHAPVITTLEGLPADSTALEARQAHLSQIAGHPIYCQPVPPRRMAALHSTKANADLIVAISPFLKRMSKALWPEPRTADIPLGVDLKRFTTRDRLLHGQNLRVQVVSAGGCQPGKRPEVFLDCARQHPEADFTWYGDGPLRASLQDQAKSEAISNLSFPGQAGPDRLAEAFRNSDLFVMPSKAEGVPKVTQEAAACGLPILAMQYYEPFTVQTGRNGFLAADDDRFKGDLAQLIADPQLRAQMGNASALMAKDWDWDYVARRWQEVITSEILQTRTRNLGT